jgi:hypothetical protein
MQYNQSDPTVNACHVYYNPAFRTAFAIYWPLTFEAYVSSLVALAFFFQPTLATLFAAHIIDGFIGNEHSWYAELFCIRTT